MPGKIDIGTLPQWLTFVTIVLGGLWVRWHLGKSKLAIDAKTVEVNAEGQLRDHYSDELKSLRDQIINMGRHHLDREREIDNRWRKLLQESEERHDECVRQREALARDVEMVKQRQLSQVRSFIAYQRSIINILPAEMKTPQLMAALETLQLEGTGHDPA